MQHYPQQLATVIRIAGLSKIKGGWSRLREAAKLVRTLRMFGAEINMDDIIDPFDQREDSLQQKAISEKNLNTKQSKTWKK